jgi:protein SCO1/2
MRRFVLLLGWGIGMLIAGGMDSRALEASPQEAGIVEKPGAQVALDSVLKDEDGNDIALRTLTGKPVILTLNYFRCAGICTPLLNGLATTLNEIGLEPGKDFQVVTVSFDPVDTPEVAHQKRINYLKQMTRPFPPSAWRFLTGSAQATKAVTDSVGFNFKAAGDGYVHAGAIIVLTPAGKVSRYLYGTSFLPADLQMAVQEAKSGSVRPTISRVLSFCYSYDPEGRRYIFSLTRLVGAIILVLAAAYVIYLGAAGRRRKGKDKERQSA